MTRDEATVGTRVRALVAVSDVPKGTAGVIDEDFGRGVMVAWDLPGRPLPRDDFDKERELHFLERAE